MRDAEIEKITRLYNQDQASGRKAVVATDIPIAYEAMTPEWLTAVVCEEHPGAKVTEFSLGPADNGTSGRRRIFLTYNEVGRSLGLPSSLFGKSSQALIHRISYKLNGSLHAETNFYNVVRPLVSIETPTSRHARSDDDSGNSIVLLDDIGDDVTFCDEHASISHADAVSMVTTLADLHGPFCDVNAFARIKPSFATWPERWAGLVRDNEMKEYTNKGFLAAEKVISPSLFARFPDIWPRTMDSVLMHEKLPHTFCHGDTHLGNWYRRNDGRMGLADWQGAWVGHWARDFIYAVACALTIENRRAWDRELLGVYLERMRQHGVSDVSFDQAWKWCRQQTLSALAYWTVTYTPSPGMPADMQPKERSLVFISRLAQAVEDLEGLDSFDGG